ncbi:MAG: hypothetical protein COR54_01460 [Elusimicrobia bacterium CG22_combo_CG10-13_8_21_14_all_63_91]|nr:MAG: hypothetical protein COR54_01460 [Elusimicrobia bacterium CG22_combo_CG10-13_8_21_14_all_63_91]
MTELNEKPEPNTKDDVLEAVREADILIEHRESEKDALTRAKRLLLAQEKSLSDPPDLDSKKRDQLLILVRGRLIQVFNHLGDTASQSAMKNSIGKLASKCREDASHEETRDIETTVLEIQNHALNILFNDYRFEEVSRIAHDLLDRRKAMRIADPDALRGEILGSLGQAMAFQARWDSSCAQFARMHFDTSLEHFDLGHRFESMSVNFLATLEWQAKDSNKAFETLKKHSNPVPYPSISDTVENFQELSRLASDGDDMNSGYLLLNLLRILSQEKLDSGKVREVASTLLDREVKSYPYPHLCRWLGAIAAEGGDNETAERLFDTCIETSQESGFTVKTLSLPAMAMKAALKKQSGKDNSSEREEALENASRMVRKSKGFGRCLEKSGGKAELEAICEAGPNWISKACRLLPWIYS